MRSVVMAPAGSACGKFAARDDGDAVGDLKDFIEVLGDHQHRRAAPRQVDERLADEGGCACIDAPGGLVDDEDFGFAVEFAPHDEFLQVAARQGPRFRVGLALPDIVFARDVFSQLGGAGIVDEGTRRQSVLAAMAGEDHVLRQGKARHGAVAEAFFRHEGRPQRPAGIDAQAGTGASGHGDGIARCSGALARQGDEQFALTVAGDPGDGHHFTRPHLEIDILQRHAEGTVGRQIEAVEGEQGGARLVGIAWLDGMHIAPHHQAGEAVGGFLSRVDFGHHLAVPQDGGVVAKALHLFEAVRDIEHRAALAREAFQGDEKLVGLLRRQDGGGLVHDQQARFLQQAAHDLDPLALAHRQIGHNR